MTTYDARIVLFAREPVAGKVKTRLIPTLGAEGARDLYLQLLRRQIAVLAQEPPCPAELWVEGDPAHPAFAGFPGALRRQRGADLGERMRRAADDVLARHGAVVIIGSDCPQLDRDYLCAALTALAQGEDAVLGPAHDGGYVLIGLRRRAPAVFAGVEWGSSRVLEQTLARLRGEGLRHRLLDTLADVDRPEDLALLASCGIQPRARAQG